jgi:cytochrome c biogenesis protein CcmG, thiol:disulfide interchange protein DsbE
MRPSEFNPAPQPPYGEPAPRRKGMRLMAIVPLASFALLAGVLAYQLVRGGDPSRVPSALIGRPAPNFSLPALPGVKAASFAGAALRQGHVTLVNVFASWCVPCRDERNLLMRLSHDATLRAQGLRIAGIAYKDAPQDSAAFLADEQPYDMIGVDRAGRVAIDWGVYGVPETFIVRGDGLVSYKLVGEITPDNIDSLLRPQIIAAEH